MAYEDVSKVNAPQLGVSKVNAKVSKVNAIRSISERHIEECKEEDKKNIKEEHVELSLDVSFPNQGSQSPDVSPEGSAAPAAPATKPKSLDEKAQCVLDYWNSTIRAGRRPLTGKTHRQEIRARINGGATWLDCVSVIADRALCWLHNQEMKDSLNPTTCFRASNFPRYLDHWLDLPAHKQAKVKDLQSFCLALPPATTDARSYTTPSTSPIRKTYTGTRRQRANASAAQ
ncbi:conserved phage C-terminal domain-containing protein [Neolewinella maritima]|nr:conserved phage C-terminal domain-containing protein [Neolewinella maritima]